MLKILFTGVVVLVVAFFFLAERAKVDKQELPVFLKTDTIANEHATTVAVNIHSVYKPYATEVDILKADYSAIWAHLNYLYATNNVNAGKEYYTEGWFKQLCNHYESPQVPIVTRYDERHELNIQNWDRDGLLCTAIDSNVVLNYCYADYRERRTKANIAVVLLLQGDHWRIDAIRIIDENPFAVPDRK